MTTRETVLGVITLLLLVTILIGFLGYYYDWFRWCPKCDCPDCTKKASDKSGPTEEQIQEKPPAYQHVKSGQEMLPNDITPLFTNGSYKLLMQKDGNVVIYKDQKDFDATNTASSDNKIPISSGILSDQGHLTFFATVDGNKVPIVEQIPTKTGVAPYYFGLTDTGAVEITDSKGTQIWIGKLDSMKHLTPPPTKTS